ncbi:hypothetical protein M9Y10_006482 [Tritrichomonas musculus]|uniref:Uncharacterized protein n=1 Tax=Tritrichomonas musculus TaxID=1915356 RepID=A0ABR2JFB3_9EUKA
MDDLSSILKEYSFRVLTDDQESIKCQNLSKINMLGEYSDCWLLLSIIFNDKYTLNSVPPFYFTSSNETFELEEKLLKIKFLVWLQYLYQRNNEVDIEKMSLIELIRGGYYDEFLTKFGNLFGSWKAEIFRGLFVFDQNKKGQSLANFQNGIKNLCNLSDITPEEQSIYKAFTGNFDEIPNFLQTEHNLMWAQLFTSYLQNAELNEFQIDQVCNFEPVEFQRFCFRPNLFENLQTNPIIDKSPKKIDPDSLAFYFNLAIVFKNKDLASFLLPSYLSVLYKCKQYHSIFKYTYFNESFFTIDESLDNVSLAASYFEPDSLFLDPLLKENRTEEVRDLLIGIKFKIIQKNDDDFLKALRWLKLDESVSKEFFQLAIEITYENVMINNFDNARKTYNLIKLMLPNTEKYFWDSYLRENRIDETDDDRIISSFKQLLIWAASLKENGQVAYGYDNNDNDEDAFESSDRLLQHLFSHITDTYQKKLNNDVMNGKPI